MQHICDMPRTVPLSEMKNIVDAIVDELGGVEGQDLLSPRTKTRTEVLRAIKDRVDFMERWDFWHGRAGRSLIANHAAKLANLAEALVSELEASPAPLVDYLFLPQLAQVTPVKRGADVVATATTDRIMLLERLERLRSDCERQKRPQRRLEPDRVKDLCAQFAFGLMQAFSCRRSYGHHMAIASLVFSLGGEKDADLKRSVDRCRRFHRLGTG